MERFREHEKEFKMKQYSKRALQADQEKQGNFVEREEWFNSGGSDSEDSNEDSNSKGSKKSLSEISGDGDFDGEVDEQLQLSMDKEWLDNFIS